MNLRPVYVRFFGGQSGSGTGFAPSSSVLPVSVIPPLPFTTTGEPFRGCVLKFSINFEEFPAGAHRNFEEKNEVFVFHNDY
jgi:hypothetical protein